MLSPSIIGVRRTKFNLAVGSSLNFLVPSTGCASSLFQLKPVPDLTSIGRNANSNLWILEKPYFEFNLIWNSNSNFIFYELDFSLPFHCLCIEIERLQSTVRYILGRWKEVRDFSWLFRYHIRKRSTLPDLRWTLQAQGISALPSSTSRYVSFLTILLYMIFNIITYRLI